MKLVGVRAVFGIYFGTGRVSHTHADMGPTSKRVH